MWDIYGNHLKSGHCEVHSHIAEVYPCSICMAERDQREQQTRMQQASYFEGELSLIEKIEHIRNVLGIVGDQQTVNLAGEVQEEVEELLRNKKSSLL